MPLAIEPVVRGEIGHVADQPDRFRPDADADAALAAAAPPQSDPA